MRILAVSALAIFALSACGGDKPRPQKPFILTDRASLGFGTEFASGTYIGQIPQDHLQVSNEGIDDLVISDVKQTGDSAFAHKLTGPLPITVKGAKQTFIEVTFAPTQPRMYTGELVITSNADNIKELHIALAGLGVNPPDAGTRDGG